MLTLDFTLQLLAKRGMLVAIPVVLSPRRELHTS
jgi:hypothetical protein